MKSFLTNKRKQHRIPLLPTSSHSPSNLTQDIHQSPQIMSSSKPRHKRAKSAFNIRRNLLRNKPFDNSITLNPHHQRSHSKIEITHTASASQFPHKSLKNTGFQFKSKQNIIKTQINQEGLNSQELDSKPQNDFNNCEMLPLYRSTNSFYTMIENQRIKHKLEQQKNWALEKEQQELQLMHSLQMTSSMDLSKKFNSLMIRIKKIRKGESTLINLGENVKKKVKILENEFRYFQINSEGKYPPFTIEIEIMEGSYIGYISTEIQKPNKSKCEAEFSGEEFKFIPTLMKFKFPLIYLSFFGQSDCEFSVVCKFGSQNFQSLKKTESQKFVPSKKSQIQKYQKMLNLLLQDSNYRRQFFQQTDQLYQKRLEEDRLRRFGGHSQNHIKINKRNARTPVTERTHLIQHKLMNQNHKIHQVKLKQQFLQVDTLAKKFIKLKRRPIINERDISVAN